MFEIFGTLQKERQSGKLCYNTNVMQQTACKFSSIMVDNVASFLKCLGHIWLLYHWSVRLYICSTLSVVFDSTTIFFPRSVSKYWSSTIIVCGWPTCGFHLLCFQIAIQPSTLFHYCLVIICVLQIYFTDDVEDPMSLDFSVWAALEGRSFSLKLVYSPSSVSPLP